jgi:hypothetical protein
MSFIVNGFQKFTEQDDYNEGCLPGTGSSAVIDYRIIEATIDAIRERVAAFIGCEVKDLDLDACDEIGRIDAGRMENAEGDEASSWELDTFKTGESTLFYAVYTCYVEKCELVSVA